jgi:transposase
MVTSDTSDVSWESTSVRIGSKSACCRAARGLNSVATGAASPAWPLVSQERLLVLLEATGGLERMLTVALERAEIAVAVLNPRQIRDFARAAGKQVASTVRGRHSKSHATIHGKSQKVRTPRVLGGQEKVSRKTC